MQKTENASKQKNEKPAVEHEEQTRSLVSSPTSEVVIQAESKSLSKDLSLRLMGLINDVNKDGVNPETVNASCKAAEAIYKILRLNFEMKKEGL